MTWESLLKTIWDRESQPYQVSNMNHTLSKFPIKLHLRVCQVCCCAGARIILLCFSRFVVHQIVFQCVCFFGLSCAKSCSNACFFSRFFVRQIVLYGLNYVESPCSCYYFSRALKVKKCGKTKNWRFCIGFLLGASARIWPEQSQPPKPKPRRILNTE